MYCKFISRIILIGGFVLLLVGCSSDESSPYTFEPPADEAVLIRNVLRENGIAIGDNQPVGEYLELGDYGNYSINLKVTGHHTIILSDNLTKLQEQNSDNNGGFHGFTACYEGLYIDTVRVVTDSIVYLYQMQISSKTKTIYDESFGKLRTKILWINGIGDPYPNGLMQLSEAPYRYDSLHLYLYPIAGVLDTGAVGEWIKKFSGWHQLPYK